MNNEEAEIKFTKERLTKEERARMKEALCAIYDDVSDDYAEQFINKAEAAADEYGANAFLRCQFETYDLVEKFFKKAKILESKIAQYETDVHYKTHFPRLGSIEAYAEFMQVYTQNLEDELIELREILPQIKQKIDEGLVISERAEHIAKNTYTIVAKSDEDALKYIKGLSIVLTEDPAPTTIAEARADAKEYYLAMRKNRLSLEGIKNDLPKTTKLKARLNAAKKENNDFIIKCKPLSKKM